jgi:hypothetical protein
MRLGEIARLVRSKNAGPFMLTVDVLFADRETFDRVTRSGALAPERIGTLYGVAVDKIMSFTLPEALTVKLSFPRDVPSGSRGDHDVYGCQYMWRLAASEVPETP